MSRTKYIRGNLKRSDFLRVLLTDTAPYEVPIIVSNDGFYKNLRDLQVRSQPYQRIVNALILAEGESFSIPYRYNIKKDEKSIRCLSLPHPRHQVAICKFYEKYTSLIPHYCSKGRFSIRRPTRVGSTFFFSTGRSQINQYKSNSVDTQDLDLFVRNPASFYTYEGFSRLYKFFGSPNFARLEKKYECMTLLDVSKCFDSIYTHTISWAIKDREHSKENLGDSSFGSEFDKLMQSMNYNETNGICIGPETSRIFAEIIFNKVDDIALQNISKTKKRYGIDFEVFRYVDDYIVFTRIDEDIEAVVSAIENGLRQFNLYINNAKTFTYKRPIVTEKTNVINGTKFHLDRMFETVIEKFAGDLKIPKKIYRPSSFTRNFISTLKDQCFKEQVRYDSISNYVVSSVVKRIERLCDDYTDASVQSLDIIDFYPVLLDELMEILFFFYTTNPTVASSFDLSRAIIVVDRFLKNHCSSHILSFSELVHRNIRQLVRLHHLDGLKQHRDIVPIEFLNVVLAASELATDVHAEEDDVVRTMFVDAKTDYHMFVSSMFYFRNRAVYSDLKNSILDNIEKLIGDCSQVKKSSHLAHLILDVLSCPFIPKKFRKRVLLKLRIALQLQKFSSAENESVLEEFVSNPWFVQWQGIDLLRMIRKKELSAVY